MSGIPRLLAILGSGETSPTMVPVHRRLLERLGPPPVPAVMLDTPAAFQENVGQLAERVVEYFARRLQQPIMPLALGGDVARPGPSGAVALARLAEARYVFAGPGSPTYALAEWSETAVPGLLADKLAQGGCVAFASAAALTLGVVTLPVYEIYKVGQPPRWLPGLDLLATTGLSAAVVPHFDNSDGGDHDTRFCYVGARRLAQLEAALPPGAFVLGLDEHTAVVFDLDAGTAAVTGRGRLTVRVRGEDRAYPHGTTVAVAELAAAAAALGAGARPMRAKPAAADGAGAGAGPAVVARLAQAFDTRLAAHDVPGATRAALELEAALATLRGVAPSAVETQGRAQLQAMLVRLGEAAGAAVDPQAAMAPLVDAILAARDRARAERQWPVADALREVLTSAGIAVRDTSAGAEWEIVGESVAQDG